MRRTVREGGEGIGGTTGGRRERGKGSKEKGEGTGCTTGGKERKGEIMGAKGREHEAVERERRRRRRD